MEEKSENQIDINKWTNDFCTALQNLSPDIQLFAAQCDSFIDQILNLTVLEPPNEESTSIFLEYSIPSLINVVINFQNSISSPELKQTFIFLISNFTLLFQWIFSSDYFQLFGSFIPVFNENSYVYNKNNGGQKPSEMWRESMKKFIDLTLFEILTLRFQEPDVRIEHFHACAQVYLYLVPVFDIKPSIDYGAQLFQYFQEFLNEITPEDYDEKIDDSQIFIKSIEKMSEIMEEIHDKSSFLKGFESYMHLLQVLIEINQEDKRETALLFISFLVNFQSEEVDEKLKEFIVQNNLFQKDKEMPSNILQLIVNDISSKDLLEYLSIINPISKCKNSLTFLQPEKMIELIKIIPENNDKIPPVLISVALLAAASKPQLTEAILANAFQKLNLSGIKPVAFSPLYDQFQTQLRDICISCMNEDQSYANSSLILGIFAEIVQKKPSFLTDDMLQHIYSLILKEGAANMLPVLEKAYSTKSKKMSREQVETLLKSPLHKQIWNLFNNLLKARGLSPFDYDLSVSVFYDFNAEKDEKNDDDNKENKTSENDLVTEEDLTDPSYIDFIFTYALCVNIKNQNIPTPPNAPSSLRPPTKANFPFFADMPPNSNNSQSTTAQPSYLSQFTSLSWIPQQFDVVKWPLTHFHYLLNLAIFNESDLSEKNKENNESTGSTPSIGNITHTESFKKLFNMLKNVNRSLIKLVVQSLAGDITVQEENRRFYVMLSLLYELVKNIESYKCLKDYGVIQHYMTDAPYETDLPNETTVTYDNVSKTVRYDPELPIIALLRSAALKFKSTCDGLVLRNKDNKMLSNQTHPHPDPEGYKMTGKLNPINYDEIPSYILSDEDISFNSFLMTKLYDELPPEVEKLIESFLEYLPTESQIQELVFNPEEFVESIKSQNNQYIYFYMIKAAIHRSRSSELISLYKKSSIFEVIKHDYLNGRFEHKNDFLLLTFLYYFFNDTQIDTEMMLRLVEEVRNIKTFNGNNKRTLEVMIKYAELSNEIQKTQEKNPLADYLIENKFIEPLITTCNDSLLILMTKFITLITPLQYIFDLFIQFPNNIKIAGIFFSVFQKFMKSKNEEEKDEIINNIIDHFVSFNDNVLNRALIAILNKDIITTDYIDKMLQTSMLITREPMRSNVINSVVDFCISQSNSQQNQNQQQQQQQNQPQQQQNQPQQQNIFNFWNANTQANMQTFSQVWGSTQQNSQQNRSIDLDLKNEYHMCIHKFLDKISKIPYVGNDLYVENPLRSNFEYARQELLHLRPFRNCLLNPENQDFFVGNKQAHDLQLYFSQMIINEPPQYLYVNHNELSPYKHLVQLINNVLPPEMRDQLITFVPSQCIVDTSIFDRLENATPVIIVHLTHYTPSSIPIDIKANNEVYNLTGIVTKQNAFNDPSIINMMNAERANLDQQNGNAGLPQKHVYRTIVLEGTSWLIYQEQFISQIDESMLYPIFQAEFNTVNNNSLKPYILFYTKEKDIPKFDINFNESPIINYSMLHFQKKDELPEDIIKDIEKVHNKTALEKFAISNTAASLFQNLADTDLLFTYFVNIYCRSSVTNYIVPFKNKLLPLNGKKNFPSLDLTLSLLDAICVTYKQMTQYEFVDVLTSVICAVINQNVVPDCKDEKNKENFEKVVKLIEKFAEIFQQLKFNFNTQNKISKIFHTFILSTNTFIADPNSNDDENESDEMDSYTICLSLNIPEMLLNALFANFSKNRSLSYINTVRANEILHCLSCFVEMLGESLKQLLVHISQIQQSNINNLELMILALKCVKYNIFTFNELSEVVLNSNQFLSNLNISSTLINGLMAFPTDQEVAEIVDIFYDDKLLISFLERLLSSVMSDNKPLIQKMIGTSSIFFLNLFVYKCKETHNLAYMIATKMVDNDATEDVSDFVVKLADHFNSELSLFLINHIITTCICDHQLIAEHLIKRAADVEFISSKSKDKDDADDEQYRIDSKNVSDSTDIFGATVYESEELDEDQEGCDYANAFFKVLENLTIKNFDVYIPFILTKLATVDNLRFFIKHFNQDVLDQFEQHEDEIIPLISICRHPLSQNSLTAKTSAENARLSKLKGYELVAEFINCVLGIDPQSSIIKKIIINRERGYVPYEFVQFIPAISTATNPEEVETYLPPKILVKSLNYSITKDNELSEEESKNEDCLKSVKYFLDILLKHHEEFDLTKCFLNIPEICKFTLKFGNTQISLDLMKLIKIICDQNSMFKDLLEDEIDTQLRRNAIVPNIDVMKMEIELNLDFENVKNNVDNVVEKIFNIHKSAVQSIVTPSPSVDSLSTLNVVDSSEYLFKYYLSKQFEKTPVVFRIFGISLLSSKVEKKFFSSAFENLNDEEFLKLSKDYIKNSKTLTQLTFDQLDMKRIWFLMKLKPECTESIKKMIPVDRRRVIMMLKLMPDGQKYASKVFSITNEEIGINNNGPKRQKSDPAHDTIHREAGSAPSLASHSSDVRPPPATNSNNNNDNNNGNNNNNQSSGNSKPYFFQRPTMPKKKPSK